MQKLSVGTVLIGAVIAIFGAFISGYFFSMGADFWNLTKGVQTVNPLFWYITVPLGLIGIGLCAYALHLMRKSKTISLVSKPDLLARSGGTEEEKKRAFKLALRKEIQELVDNIKNSKGYKLFHYQEWSLPSPSERRSLLDTDTEWSLLTDFYGKLQARNDYASKHQPYDATITKNNMVTEFDNQYIEAGSRALNDIVWGR